MLIDKFFENGRQFFGCKYPFICGAMAWVRDPKLVSAIIDGDTGRGSLMTGQSVGPVDIEQPLCY